MTLFANRDSSVSDTRPSFAKPPKSTLMNFARSQASDDSENKKNQLRDDFKKILSGFGWSEAYVRVILTEAGGDTIW